MDRPKATRALDRPRRLDPEQPSVSLTVRLARQEYDAVYDRAQVAGCTMPEFVRRVLRAGAATRDDPQ